MLILLERREVSFHFFLPITITFSFKSYPLLLLIYFICLETKCYFLTPLCQVVLSLLSVSFLKWFHCVDTPKTQRIFVHTLIVLRMLRLFHISHSDNREGKGEKYKKMQSLHQCTSVTPYELSTPHDCCIYCSWLCFVCFIVCALMTLLNDMHSSNLENCVVSYILTNCANQVISEK